MTTEQAKQTVPGAEDRWWEQGWSEEVTFEQWLAAWEATTIPGAALGLLDTIFEVCDFGHWEKAARFLFRLTASKLSAEARRETWRRRPAAPERIKCKAQDVFVFQFLGKRVKGEEQELSVGVIGVFVNDAAQGGTMFRDLMTYIEENCYGSLDDETRHYLSVVRKFLLAVNECDGRDELVQSFCRLRDLHLCNLYRAMIACGLDDAIRREDDRSLSILREIVFEPAGFPVRPPRDIAEAVVEGHKITRKAAIRLMFLQALKKGKKRRQQRDERRARIRQIEESLARIDAPTRGITQTEIRRRRARLTAELAVLKGKSAGQE